MRAGKFEGDLMHASDARHLCKYLKEFDRAFAYRNKEVLGIELSGYQIITGLMDMLWEAITEYEDKQHPREKSNPFANYAFGRISENYRRVFEKDTHLPLRYRELQLLTDMISGMTDSYALDLFHELKERRNGPYAPRKQN